MTLAKLDAALREADRARCRHELWRIPELARKCHKHDSDKARGEAYHTILNCECQLAALVDRVEPDAISEQVDALCLSPHEPARQKVPQGYPTSRESLALNNARPPTPVPTGPGLAQGNARSTVLSAGSQLCLADNGPTTAKAYIELSTRISATDPTFVLPKPRLAPAHHATLVDVQQKLANVKTQAKTSDDLYPQFKVVLAMSYFYEGQDSKCATLLSSLPDQFRSTLAPEYARILTLQRWVVLGMCLEATDKFLALDLYQKAVDFYKTIQNPHLIPEFLQWFHAALYRGSLMSLCNPVKDQALALCRYYVHLAKEWPTTFEPHCRLVFLTQFIRALSQAYRQGQYLPEQPPQSRRASLESALPEPIVYYPTTFKSELTTLYELYEQMVPVVYHFPQAHETYFPIITMVDQAVSDWELMNAQSRPEVLVLVQMLYRFSHYTYNSLHILRHLVHTLIIYGDYHEAELALRSYREQCEHYLKQVQVHDTAVAASPPLHASQSPTLSPMTDEQSPAVPERRSSLLRSRQSVASGAPVDPNASRHIARVEPESVPDMVRTLVVGARLLVRNLAKYREAEDVLDYCISLSSMYPDVPTTLLAQVHHYQGYGFSQICLQAKDPDKRAKYQELAFQAYQRSLVLDSRNAETLYHFGLHHAISRNVEQAMTMVKDAIELRPAHLSSWNLLVLLVSSQKDYQQALQLCEIGCQESEWCDIDARVQLVVFSHTSSGPIAPPDLAPAAGLDDGEAYLDLKITQCLLYELLYGPQSALQLHSILFTLFSKIYGSSVGPASTPLVSMAWDAHPLAGFLASPGSPSNGPTYQSSTRDILSTSNLSLARVSHHRRAKAFLNRSTHTMHLATAEGKTLAKLARDKVRGIRRGSIGTTGTAHDSPRFSTLRASPKINFQSSVSVNTYPAHQRTLSTSWLPGGGQSSTAAPANHSATVLPTTGHHRTVATTAATPSSAKPAKVPEHEDVKELYKSTLQRQRARQVLADLWLMSAAAFRRLGRHKDAQAAIVEAESVYPEYPAVWCQHGLLISVMGANDTTLPTTMTTAAATATAQTAAWLSEQSDLMVSQENLIAGIRHFLTGLALGPDDVPTRVHLARAYLRIGKEAIATGLLQELTRGCGWDVAEAWALLAQIMLQREKDALASDYLVFASQLESTKPIRPFQWLSW
ncbi:hypothetical protein H4R34_002926 [Dimargaris verticillata]|uniref:Uncharacterized protein n=1 Tax=Dimargaris verticillata TaxID=2761393 RepID=A0A9W8ED43_9FUNG|nr:hypothetical protein H4R34_002926 [Dimargaris verticillata]